MKNSRSTDNESLNNGNSLSSFSERAETDPADKNEDELALSESFPGALSPEDVKRLKAAQKRNFIFAAIFGILLLVLGYFAGGNMRKMQEEEPAQNSQVIIVESFDSLSVLADGVSVLADGAADSTGVGA